MRPVTSYHRPIAMNKTNQLPKEIYFKNSLYIYIYKGQTQLHNLKMQLGNLGRKQREVNTPVGAFA